MLSSYCDILGNVSSCCQSKEIVRSNELAVDQYTLGVAWQCLCHLLLFALYDIHYSGITVLGIVYCSEVLC